MAANAPWLWLLVAGALEVVWVALLRRSDGLTRIGPGIFCLVALSASLWCMSRALLVLPMGTVYAVWTGLGAAGGLVWGIVAAGEPLTAARVGCVALILAGVAGLKLGQ